MTDLIFSKALSMQLLSNVTTYKDVSLFYLAKKYTADVFLR